MTTKLLGDNISTTVNPTNSHTGVKVKYSIYSDRNVSY